MEAKYRKQELFSHGVRARYTAGCRCTKCRESNRSYAHAREVAKRDGDFNGTVSAKAAQRHLLKLSKAGIGRRSIERVSGISSTVLHAIKRGKKTRIRARTEKLILSVTELYTRGPIPGDFGYCEPCRKEKKHLCLATSTIDGIAKCDGCTKGVHCNWHSGSGWFRGDGSKGRPSSLPTVKKLGRKHPHGHFMRYLAGCKCSKCKQGRRDYDKELAKRRELFGPNDLVSTDKVKTHLHWLQTFGIGHLTISKITGVGKTSMAEILWYAKTHMRRRAANAILAVRPNLDTFPKNIKIPGTETIEKIKQLMKWGIPRRNIDRDGLGNHGFALQATKRKSGLVTVRTALSIRDYFERVVKMRSIWIRLGRTIPVRHYVYWKPNRHGMTARSFELRPYAVTYDYNLYPQELKNTISVLAKLKRGIRQKGEHHGQEQTV